MARHTADRHGISSDRGIFVDVGFRKFCTDCVSVTVETSDLETRIVATLRRMRRAFGPTTPAVTQYIGLATALDDADRAIPQGTPTEILAHLERNSKMVARVVDAMRLADGAIGDGLGLAAFERLHVAPQRILETGATVILFGAFQLSGTETLHTVVINWRLSSLGGGRQEPELLDIDEHNGDEGALKALIDIAVELNGVPDDPNARVALLVARSTLESIGESEQIARRVVGLGTVFDARVEAIIVDDPRYLEGADQLIAERGYDHMLVVALPFEQWAFRRAEAFNSRGKHAHLIPAHSMEAAFDQIRASLEAIPAADRTVRALDTALLAEGPVRVVVVGGNETQAQYRTVIETDLERRFGAGVEVVWFGGWASSWDAIADAVDRELATSHALVLMDFVRTGLGQTLRRKAGDHAVPWIKTKGAGRSGIQRAIETVLLKVLELRKASVERAAS